MKPLYLNPGDGQTIALLTIGWIVADPGRSERFLGLTGLDAGQLRAGLSDPAILAAALDFLLAHEPDLVACAESLEVAPETILAARAEIA